MDFGGHHRKESRYDRRLRALLGGSRLEVASQVEQGFPLAQTQTLLAALKGRIAHPPAPLTTHPEVRLTVHARDTRSRSSRPSASATPPRSPMADRRVLGQGREGRPPRLHPRQDPRPLLANHRLPRLREHPRPVHWESQSVTRADGETG